MISLKVFIYLSARCFIRTTPYLEEGDLEDCSMALKSVVVQVKSSSAELSDEGSAGIVIGVPTSVNSSKLFCV
jgi:hypothetical protein